MTGTQVLVQCKSDAWLLSPAGIEPPEFLISGSLKTPGLKTCRRQSVRVQASTDVISIVLLAASNPKIISEMGWDYRPIHLGNGSAMTPDDPPDASD